jgi:hypothetical protein
VQLWTEKTRVFLNKKDVPAALSKCSQEVHLTELAIEDCTYMILNPLNGLYMIGFEKNGVPRRAGKHKGTEDRKSLGSIACSQSAVEVSVRQIQFPPVSLSDLLP